MYYLGLDASTKSTGYAIYKDDILIEHGIIKSKLPDYFDRIEEIYNECKKIFERYNIYMTFIEDVPMAGASNRRVAEKLIILQGTILSLCFQFDSGFIQMEPSNWRRLAGVVAEKNRRPFQKKAAIEMVVDKYGFDYEWIDEKTDEKTGHSDACEAILVGKAGLVKIGVIEIL